MSPRAGAATITAACALVALTTVISKQLGSGSDALSPFQITWGRYVFALTAISIFYAIRRPTITRMHVPLHVFRVTFGVLGVTALFASTTLIPLADATAISFANAVIAMVLAALFLGERVGPIRWVAVAVAFVGMLLLVRPGTSAFQPNALVAVLAACLLAVEIIAVKVLSDREPTFQILVASNVGGTITTSSFMLWFWQWPTPDQWVLLAAIGLVMVSAQAMFVPALCSGDASFIAPFSYSTLLFATIYDLALFGVVPVFWSICGALLIVTAGIVMAVRGEKA